MSLRSIVETTSKVGGLRVRVAAKTVEAAGICSFELVEASGGVLPSFSAGSHIDVELSGGLTRQYSLCNDPAETHRYLVAVLHDPQSRGGSAAMHDGVHPGDVLSISEPKNHFALAHESKKSLLLAGGIGVTPILCMAERLQAIGADFEMHYCARSKGHMAFVERIGRAPFAPKVQLHFDDGDESQKFDISSRLAAPESDTHLYVCGPKGFMNAVLEAARNAGWPEPHIHYEFFSGESVRQPGDEDFEVQIASSGRVIIVPKDKTVAQALRDAGVEVPTSCEQGVCGTCLTRVLSGTPDHRDLFLTPEEQAANDRFTPCCSRAKSGRLILDL